MVGSTTVGTIVFCSLENSVFVMFTWQPDTCAINLLESRKPTKCCCSECGGSGTQTDSTLNPPDSSASHASSLDTSLKIPPRPQCPGFSEDRSKLGIVFQCCPVINLLCPAVSLPVTQASSPSIRWCSATTQQPDKIHSLQEVEGIRTKTEDHEPGIRLSSPVPVCLFITPHAHFI